MKYVNVRKMISMSFGSGGANMLLAWTGENNNKYVSHVRFTEDLPSHTLKMECINTIDNNSLLYIEQNWDEIVGTTLAEIVGKKDSEEK